MQKRGEKMKIEASIQELEQLFKKFTFKKNTEIKIDGTTISKFVEPSKTKTINHLENHD